MPNRIIKESICTSENIDALSAFEETFFIRLIVNCDDFGRMDARPKLLASKLYPLRDVKPAQMENCLISLAKHGLITLYTVGDHDYLQMATWGKHQQVRNKKSRYPSPDDGICKELKSIDIHCNQKKSNDSNCISNPIQSNTNPILSESESESNGTSAVANDLTEMFNRFWKAYPRKESKPDAKRAFQKIKPDEELLQTILNAIDRWKASAQWTEDGGRFIPYPASWLNQRKWEDEPMSAKQTVQANRRVLPAQDFQQRDYSGVQTDLMSEIAREIEKMKKEEGA